MTEPERPHIDALTRAEDNVRVALDRLVAIDPGAALQLAFTLTTFWWVQAKHREGMGRARSRAGCGLRRPGRAAGLFGKAFLLAHDTDDWAAAGRVFDEGIGSLSLSDDATAVPPHVLGLPLCLRGLRRVRR
jgi:hypothetical protein